MQGLSDDRQSSPEAGQTRPTKPQVYSTQFWLLCLSALLFSASFNMIIPELPAYLTQLGGAEYKGLIISLFTLTAMISRPFSGKLADKVGRIPVMIFGAVVCFICGFVYPLLSSVAAFFLLRTAHGFSTGFTPTGQTAFLADIIPADRRGEAVGILGTAGTLGMGLGPPIGDFVASNFTLDILFYVSSVFAVVSILVLMGIRETLLDKRPFSFSLLKIDRADLLEPRVMMACIVMGMTSYMYGAVYTLLPDFGEFTGIKNKGLLFMYFTFASLMMRFVAGRASDRHGRTFVLKISTLVMGFSALIIGFSTSQIQLITGIIVYGVAHGMTSPTLFAWTADLSDANHKGRGLASLYVFLELGIGVGALWSGLLFNNNTGQFPVTFIFCSVMCMGAFGYLMSLKKIKVIAR